MASADNMNQKKKVLLGDEKEAFLASRGA